MRIDDERREDLSYITIARKEALAYMAEDDPLKRIVLRDLIDLEKADFQIEVSKDVDTDRHNKACEEREGVLKRIDSNRRLPAYNTRAGEIEELILGLESAIIKADRILGENEPNIGSGQDISYRRGAIRIFPTGPIPL